MILHNDSSVTLTEEEWLKARPRWISMVDANPDDGEVVLCYLLNKRGHKEYRRLSWCDHYGNWDDESGDDYFCDRECISGYGSRHYHRYHPCLPPRRHYHQMLLHRRRDLDKQVLYRSTDVAAIS